jgi:hypothetical protein
MTTTARASANDLLPPPRAQGRFNGCHGPKLFRLANAPDSELYVWKGRVPPTLTCTVRYLCVPILYFCTAAWVLNQRYISSILSVACHFYRCKQYLHNRSDSRARCCRRRNSGAAARPRAAPFSPARPRGVSSPCSSSAAGGAPPVAPPPPFLPLPVLGRARRVLVAAAPFLTRRAAPRQVLHAGGAGRRRGALPPPPRRRRGLPRRVIRRHETALP